MSVRVPYDSISTPLSLIEFMPDIYELRLIDYDSREIKT